MTRSSEVETLLRQLPRDEVRRLLIAEEYQTAREQFLTTVIATLVDVEGWLAIDSWLGGGSDGPGPSYPGDIYQAHRGLATIVCMSAELAETAQVMAHRDRTYAVGAVIRQLIECEYFLTLFEEDLSWAERWSASTPEQIRNTFSPATMRKRTGKFSNEEYWGHCDAGGHPAPKGARLLEKLDPTRATWPYAAAELKIDLGLHLHRIWSAVNRLLVAHHPRFASVFGDRRERVDHAWSEWRKADPIMDIVAR